MTCNALPTAGAGARACQREPLSALGRRQRAAVDDPQAAGHGGPGVRLHPGRGPLGHPGAPGQPLDLRDGRPGRARARLLRLVPRAVPCPAGCARGALVGEGLEAAGWGLQACRSSLHDHRVPCQGTRASTHGSQELAREFTGTKGASYKHALTDFGCGNAAYVVSGGSAAHLNLTDGAGACAV